MSAQLVLPAKLAAKLEDGLKVGRREIVDFLVFEEEQRIRAELDKVGGRLEALDKQREEHVKCREDLDAKLHAWVEATHSGSFAKAAKSLEPLGKVKIDEFGVSSLFNPGALIEWTCSLEGGRYGSPCAGRLRFSGKVAKSKVPAEIRKAADALKKAKSKRKAESGALQGRRDSLLGELKKLPAKRREANAALTRSALAESEEGRGLLKALGVAQILIGGAK